MAVLVGMGLSVSGAVYQALFRNPLVSPDILGVAAGCTFGAALGLVMPGYHFSLVHVLSFGFGLLAVFLAIGIARLIAVRPIIVLVLAGMVVMSFFNALLMVLKYFSDPFDELPSIVFWIMGSLSRVTWSDIFILAPVTLLGVVVFMLFRFRINILSLGDVQSKSLGMNPGLFRFIFIVTSSFIVAMTVATCGQIAWIGLIIPHMARTIAGPEHERMLPVTALLGALFLLGADDVARSVSTAEIPVGIITALTGAPIFGFLLYKNRGSGWI
jgi:iron complex transport system permease protein